jgi:RNA polymerase sigma-70 factor (ECF subfamily)
LIVQATSYVAEETGWIASSQRGDREAFNELVCLHRADVINVVYRMCGDAGLAEDAAQVAFIQAWRHLPTFQLRTTFRCWLYRIAINAAVDMLRRDRPAANIDDLPLTSTADKLETRLEQQERIQHIRQAVLNLPEASRAVLVLREYEGLTYQEIAEALDIPTGTVMSRLSYARKLLTERLKPYLEEA